MSLSDELHHIIEHGAVRDILKEEIEQADSTDTLVVISVSSDGAMGMKCTKMPLVECIGLLEMAKDWALEIWRSDLQEED